MTPSDPSDSDVDAQGIERSAMSTVVRWRDRTAVIAVAGEIDMVTAPLLDQALCEILGQRPGTLVVDLSEVRFLASAGLNSLVAAYQRAGSSTALRLVATNSSTLRPLEVTALNHRIQVFSSVEAADS